jgi:hypothetical protein
MRVSGVYSLRPCLPGKLICSGPARLGGLVLALVWARWIRFAAAFVTWGVCGLAVVHPQRLAA